ncbi:MAG: protein kinase [Candidatus Schekmanbacteria bacterium]|nr:protein kinase [Candidatus Schekmanbacteria bacterium]
MPTDGMSVETSPLHAAMAEPLAASSPDAASRSNAAYMSLMRDVATRPAAESPATSDAPEARARFLGPYELCEILGHGGMGVVYRARHRDTAEPVAVKTVRISHHRFLQGIAREIHALARISHPGIVRIVASGFHDDVPWYAMDFVQGVTLRKYLMQVRRVLSSVATGPLLGSAFATVPATSGDHWWTQALRPTGEDLSDDGARLGLRCPAERSPEAPVADSPDLPSCLVVLRRLCRSLSYLHGEGIVHRDLKPENVVVRADGTPVLMDFGLMAEFARELSRETLTIDGRYAGTPLYVAPEQIKGELVDARADLYSLGCMMYEMFVGSPPFIARTAQEVFQAHVTVPPVAPRDRGVVLLPELEELVMRLLEKEPRRRIGYAADVEATLGRLGVRDSVDESWPRAQPYLYRPSVEGRDDEIQRLLELVWGLALDQGALAIISGETGVGKTRLAVEIGREAEALEILTVTGTCFEGAREPLEGLKKPLDIIAGQYRDRGVAQSANFLGERGRVLGIYEAALESLPDTSEEIPTGEARLRLFAYLTDTLLALANDDPILLLLDDLQWADNLTLGWLAFLAEHPPLAQVPLLLIGTCRSEEMPVALESVVVAPGVTHLVLERLSERAVAAIVADMLALADPPAALSRYLTQQSEGNPCFVAEYLRAALSEGLLWRDDAGKWHVAEPGGRPASTADYEALPLPKSLHDLVSRRLSMLGTAASRMLDAVAVIAQEAGLVLIQMVSKLHGRDLVEGVEELLRRQVLEEHEPGILRFVHDQLREVAYRRLAPESRRKLHREVAEGMEILSASGTSMPPAKLARHWELAGILPRAQTHYLQAARRANRAHAPTEAEQYYTAYLSLVRAASAESIAVTRELATEVLSPQGRIAEARRALESTQDDALLIGESALAAATMVDRAQLERRFAGALAEADALIHAAARLYEHLDDALGLAGCHCQWGHIAMAQELSGAGHLEIAERILGRTAQPRDRAATRAVERLRLAVRAFEAKSCRDLYQGELISALPLAVRARVLVGLDVPNR